MKKIALALILCVKASFFGCSEFALEKPLVNEAKIQALVDLQGHEQKLAYSTLSENEKVVVWDRKFQSYLISKEYSDPQKKLIEQLVEFNKTYSGLSKQKRSGFESQWLAEASVHFSYGQISKIAYKLSTDQVTIEENPNGGYASNGGELPSDGNLPNCYCNKGSLYSCDTPSFACPVTQGPCDNPSILGCGFMWIHPCDGICKVTGD